MQRRSFIFLRKSKIKKPLEIEKKKFFQLIHFKRSQFFIFAFLQKMLNVSLEHSAKNIWDKIFKNVSSEICGRKPLRNFNCSVLEYLDPYQSSFQIRLKTDLFLKKKHYIIRTTADTSKYQQQDLLFVLSTKGIYL